VFLTNYRKSYAFAEAYISIANEQYISTQASLDCPDLINKEKKYIWNYCSHQDVPGRW